MWVAVVNKLQLNGEDQGLVHYPGLDCYDIQTLCGHSLMTTVDMMNRLVTYEDTAKRVTCTGCIRARDEIRHVMSWLKTRRLK